MRGLVYYLGLGGALTAFCRASHGPKDERVAWWEWAVFVAIWPLGAAFLLAAAARYLRARGRS